MDWLSLPSLRDKYQSKVQQLEMLKEIEPNQSMAQKQLYADCWEIRKAAYRILVKEMDAGGAIEQEALPFNWSVAQLSDTILRDWLALSKIIRIITSRCSLPFLA